MKIILLLLLAIIIAACTYTYANASASKTLIKDGEILFNTIDTKATTQVRWRTVGFTICREKTYGNPNASLNKAVIMLNSNWKQDNVLDKNVEVSFTVPEEELNKALKKAGLSEIIKDGDKLYFNGIFRIVEGGTEVKNEEYNTLQAIKKARAWRNPNDFLQHFDIEVIYKESKKLHPVSIEYQKNIDGEFIKIGERKLQDQKNFSKIKIDTNLIPTKKDDYYLYRVYYVFNKKPNVKKLDRKTYLNPNISYDEYKDDLVNVRDRDFVVEDGGIKIVAVYKKYNKKLDIENMQELVKDLDSPDAIGIIDADLYKNERYDVRDGIPVNESLYAKITAKKNLISYKFIRKYGTKYYNVSVSKNVTLKYKETDIKTGKLIDKEESRDIIKTYQIPRKYSYWQIEDLNIYKIDSATINTDALDQELILSPIGYNLMDIEVERSIYEKDHITEPNLANITLQAEIVNANKYPDYDFKDIAESALGQIICKNDKLIFGDEIIMSDEKKSTSTKRPSIEKIDESSIKNTTLFKSNLLLPIDKKNGDYTSKAEIAYFPYVSTSNLENCTYNIEINDVTVHNPVICDGMVENKYKYNQMINPQADMASLILDMPFYIGLSTYGNHHDYKGYGQRDYGKHIIKTQVKFPFDVYEGNDDQGDYIKKDTWLPINGRKQYYLPIWVEEGNYSIEFRSIGINAIANNMQDKMQEYANLDIDNYAAYDRVDVNISGRIYNFNLYDVSDYPLWEKVFRQETGSTLLSGNKFKVENLPLLDGSHPKYKNIGSIKLGYYTRFSLTTVGSMYNDNDYIRIKPTFYHIKNDGSDRQEVDLYYSETVNDVKNIMVKMGSDIDLKNKKSIKTGDLYLSINEKEQVQTAILNNMTLDDYKNQNKNAFTFTNIMLPASLRTYIGYIKNVPKNITKEQIAKSKQNWYGEYYLPSDLYLVAKDFDLNAYIKENKGLTLKEDFWLRDGYIVLNFAIESIKDGKRHLSYINPVNSKYGYCNMWEKEGYKYKTYDAYENKHIFLDGDYVLYNINKSAKKDWIFGGTH